MVVDLGVRVSYVSIVMTDDEIDEFTKRAKSLAEATSATNLPRMAEITQREHAKLPTSDDRTQVGIMHNAYVAEIQRRVSVRAE